MNPCITYHSTGEPVKKVTSGTEPALVLLHGWGSNGAVWDRLLPHLQGLPVLRLNLPGFDVSQTSSDEPLQPLDNKLWQTEALLEALAEVIPTGSVVMGWSLGGMLAVALAERYPSLCQGVISIAANAQFVATLTWPEAMPKADFEGFFHGFAANPTLARKRFCGLQARGDIHEKALLQQLRADVPRLPSNDSWLHALQCLAAIDNRDALPGLACPGLHFFGEQDALVPVAAARRLQSSLPASQTVEILLNTAHAPHITLPEVVAGAVQRWLVESKLSLAAVDHV